MSMADLLAAEEVPENLQQFLEEESQEKVAKSEPEVKQEAEVDPLVAKAQKGGWTDRDAWIDAGKDPDQWVDAKEFVSREPLYEKNRQLKRELQEERKRTEKVAQYASRAAETARKQLLAEIEEQRLKAVEIGDVDGFKEAEQRRDDVLNDPDYRSPEVEKEPETIPVPVKEFADRNAKWFEKDKPMTIYMVETTKEYTASGKPLEEAIKLAEADVKREFAHKFENPNKHRASAVGSSNKESRPTTVTHADLNAEQRAVWSTLKAHMTFDEFVTGLKEQGEFK